jgi:hypothetical protein
MDNLTFWATATQRDKVSVIGRKSTTTLFSPHPDPFRGVLSLFQLVQSFGDRPSGIRPTLMRFQTGIPAKLKARLYYSMSAPSFGAKLPMSSGRTDELHRFRRGPSMVLPFSFFFLDLIRAFEQTRFGFLPNFIVRIPLV